MSTTSHKSPTRIKSEAAMKSRVHTSRKDRELTGDGLDKHHHEATTLKVRSKTIAIRTSAKAKEVKKMR